MVKVKYRDKNIQKPRMEECRITNHKSVEKINQTIITVELMHQLCQDNFSSTIASFDFGSFIRNPTKPIFA
jgi:hypothetical protein